MFPLIRSHPRSGTNYLAATIAKRFDVGDVSGAVIWRDPTPYVTERGVHNAGDDFVIPWKRLTRRHTQLYDDVPEADRPAILFLVRHPRDALLSMRRWRDPHRQDPGMYLGEAAALQWFNRVRPYVEAGCFTVRYEDLTDPELHDIALARIEHQFDLQPRDGYEPIETRVGHQPAVTPVDGSEDLQIVSDSLRAVMPEGYIGYEW